jgi:hypothetical protein
MRFCMHSAYVLNLSTDRTVKAAWYDVISLVRRRYVAIRPVKQGCTGRVDSGPYSTLWQVDQRFYDVSIWPRVKCHLELALKGWGTLKFRHILAQMESLIW